jgi:hypothetical protein
VQFFKFALGWEQTQDFVSFLFFGFTAQLWEKHLGIGMQ